MFCLISATMAFDEQGYLDSRYPWTLCRCFQPKVGSRKYVIRKEYKVTVK